MSDHQDWADYKASFENLASLRSQSAEDVFKSCLVEASIINLNATACDNLVAFSHNLPLLHSVHLHYVPK